MNARERHAAESAYRRLFLRLRAVAARTSRSAIATYDALVAEVIQDLLTFRVKSTVLTLAEARQLTRRIATALERIERGLLETIETAKDTIWRGIVEQHRAVQLELGLPEMGRVTLRLQVVRSEARSQLVQLRSGRAVRTIVGGHVDDVEEALGRYIQGLTGEAPGADALRGIRRLLEGDLPFDLGGVSKQEARVAASLPWKAERLIVTESWEGFRQGQNAALQAAPVKLVALWKTQEDERVCTELKDRLSCTELSEADIGFGPGWYPPEDWPESPHPWCRCYQGDIRILDAET